MRLSIRPGRRIPICGASHSCDLAGLMGHTRAAVLEALRTPRSTAELAACVGTSAPSASEHTTALRASGLVQTVRRGRGVNHSLTPLGRSLLNGNLNARLRPGPEARELRSGCQVWVRPAAAGYQATCGPRASKYPPVGPSGPVWAIRTMISAPFAAVWVPVPPLRSVAV